MKEYFQNIVKALWSVLLGMGVTASYLFRPAVTLQYPEEKLYPEAKRRRKSVPILFDWTPPDRYRGDLSCVIDDCIGCMLCAAACPVECIDIVTERAAAGEDLERTSKGQPKKLKILRFDIDMTKCIFCGLCVDPCPTECLTMTRQYEFSSYGRAELVHHFARPERYARPAAAVPAGGPSPAAAPATAPSSPGSAAAPAHREDAADPAPVTSVPAGKPEAR